LAEGAAGRGTTASSDAIAPMFAKAYPNIGMGANEKILLSNKGRTMKKAHGNSMLSRRRIIKGAGVLAAGIAAPAFLRIRSAYAAYPERPVKIVVANTPGGPSDIVGRIVAAALEQSTGKTFIIENRGGAGSNIGMGYVARSDPDGYTILLATNAYSVNATLYNTIPYDPLKDFVGVSELATSPNTFVVRSELPAKTMKEFVALAKASPEKFNCATPPIGTTPQIQLEVLKIRENLPKLEDVVFKGGGDALQALLSSTVQLSSGSLPPAAPHIKAGTLRCLAVTGETRWPDMPDVPTMVEAGYPDFVFATDTVLMAPAKTPPEAVKWLEKETLKILGTPDMKEKLYKSGFQVRPKGADAAWARVSKEIGMFKDIIDKSGMKKL
jgi:tripartite-type tricarboxylate transporter receptor subunit TctC